jgi:hypothetical protein
MNAKPHDDEAKPDKPVKATPSEEYLAKVTAVAQGVKILCDAGMGASTAGELAADLYRNGK